MAQDLKKMIEDLVTIVKNWGVEAKLIEGNGVETEIGETRLLLLVGVKDKLFCLMIAKKLHDQLVYQQIIRGIRSLGFESPAYTSGTYWKCSDITECAFFEKRDDGHILQLLADETIAEFADEINGLIQPWDDNR